MKKQIIFALVLSSVFLGSSQADEMSDLKAEGKVIIKKFFTQLKGTLMSANKAGGPTNAIDACNTEAPGIAITASRYGWKVARTSLKIRNKDNAPDDWELKVLKQFEARKAKGEDPKNIAYAEIVKENGKRSFRMMKAIPTAKLCTTCHGANIKPAVVKMLDKHYPQDKARGFSEGDIRGAFTLKKALF